jgi:hypothetical protein
MKKMKGYATHAVPLIDPNIQIPADEDFQQWCENPVTMFVALAFSKIIERQREEWEKVLGQANLSLTPEMLNNVRIDLRARIDAHEAFLLSKKEDYESIIEE